MSVENALVPNNLIIYPNPISTIATLTSEKPLDHATLNIYDVLGKKAKQMDNVSGNTVTLNRDGLTNGIYFLHIGENNKTLAVKKLVIID